MRVSDTKTTSIITLNTEMCFQTGVTSVCKRTQNWLRIEKSFGPRKSGVKWNWIQNFSMYFYRFPQHLKYAALALPAARLQGCWRLRSGPKQCVGWLQGFVVRGVEVTTTSGTMSLENETWLRWCHGSHVTCSTSRHGLKNALVITTTDDDWGIRRV